MACSGDDNRKVKSVITIFIKTEVKKVQNNINDEEYSCEKKACDKEKECVREGGKEYIVKKLEDVESLTGRMLVKNNIASLISASLREFNGESYLYYDISGKIRFSDMFSGENDFMQKDDVEKLCQSFLALTDDLRDYLLEAEEIIVSPEYLFFDSDKKVYEFLYIPGRTGDESFNDGVKAVWDRVMEKFNHQSDLETIAKVYDIYQKVSMISFDPEEVFAPSQKNSSEENKEINSSAQDSFCKERLKDTIAGVADRCADAAITGNVEQEQGEQKEQKAISFIDGLKVKLAGSAGFFSTGTDKKIEAISKNMEKEEKLDYRIKNYLALNSGNIFKVLMCVAVLFIILALMPADLAFKPPVSACVGVFLVCVAVAVYARKLGKERAEDEA